MAILTIQCAQQASIILRRPDGLFYNPDTKTFVKDAQKIPTKATAFDDHLFELQVPIDPKQFPDGDYSIYFYIGDKLIDSAFSTIYQGDVHRQTPTDYAVRLLQASIGGVPFRDAITKLCQQVDKIAKKLEV